MARLLFGGILVLACLYVVLADDQHGAQQRKKKSGEHQKVKNIASRNAGGRKLIKPSGSSVSTDGTTTPKPKKRFQPGTNPCSNACTASCNTAQMSLGCGFCKIPNMKCYDGNSVCSISSGSMGTCKCKTGFFKSGSSCAACAAGSISNSANTACTTCAANAIAVNNVCTACPTGQVRSASNTCVTGTG